MNIEPFSLTREKMEIYVHLRLENHGPEEKANGYDIKLKGRFSNSVLLKFDPDLRDSLYTDEKQRDLEEFKKKLRFPRIVNAMKWQLEIPRAVLTLHDGEDPKEDLEIADGKAKDFVLLPMEGGTVEVSIRYQCPQMSEEQVTKMLRANGQALKISLECREAEPEPDNFQQVDLLSQQNMSPARAEAERQFAAGMPDQTEEIAQTLAAAPPPEELAPTEAQASDPAAKPRRRAKAVAGIE